MLADQVDYVLGGDTHRDEHTIAAVIAATGGVIATRTITTKERGYQAALRFARRHAPGRRIWALEGTGSYGAGLTRFLLAQGERVIEVDRPIKHDQRTAAKDDELDAIRAARTALARAKHATPRSDPAADALTTLVTTRGGAVTARTAAINQLRALVVVAPEPLRTKLRDRSADDLVTRCLRLRTTTAQPANQRSVTIAMRSLATRIRTLTREQQTLAREITRIVTDTAPFLLAEPGVGPITAAQLLISWSHPGRFASEARFARIAGAAPIPASSGLTPRYRLDRGGDRQRNRALHTIALSRSTRHPPTRAYLDRRISEGKTRREAVRLLKRYLARHFWRLLEHTPTGTPPPIMIGPCS